MTLTRSPRVSGWIIRVGSLSIRLAPRVFWVGLTLCVMLVALASWALLHGTIAVTGGQVIAAIFGDGEASIVRTVRDRRLPRLITAICVGGALGIARAFFQSVSRNALGSPDIIGFTSGAAAGAVTQLVLFNGGMVATAISAVAGGVVTASAVYLLARRDGVTGGLRLVLVGIGVGAIASAITNLHIVRAGLYRAQSAQQWLAGALVGRGWTHAVSMFVVLVALAVPVVVIARRLTYLELGDDLAAGLGMRTERTRLAAVAVGIGLTSTAVAATGPIAFIALAAPQLIIRLYRKDGVHPGGAFGMGAVLLVAADLLSMSVDIGLRTPVGTVTALLGGMYLIWLLARRV